MKAAVRGPESQRGSYRPVLSVGNVRVRARFRFGWLVVWAIAISSLVFFVTGSITTPVRDETFAFVIFVFSASLIVRRIRRTRRRGWRRHLPPNERRRCVV